MIELKNAGVSFNDKKVLDKLNLSVKENEFLAVLGPNGSGKSTLAHLIAGLIPEFISAGVEGKIKINGKVGLIMQNPSSQFFALTVKEELGNQNVQRFRIKHLVGKSVFQLSEGEKQKINLISNLLNEVDILLLDEPLELLDPLEARNFLEFLSKQKNKTIIWFDKDNRFVKGKKALYLKKPKKSFQKKNKKTPKGNSTVLEANFSYSFNGFSLKDIRLSLREGEKIALVGLNGSGKSTLLKCIAGVHKIQGTVELNSGLGYAPQEPGHLLFKDTVKEEALNKELFELFELRKISSLDPGKASKGQQKMVSIASLPEKGIFLLDEPTTWLDEENRQRVYQFINSSQNAMLIATHDPALVKNCDRVFLLNGGLKECSSTAVNRFFQNGLTH